MKCACETLLELTGNEADQYAKEHLVELELDAVNWTVRYRCPNTGTMWLRDSPHQHDGSRATHRRVRPWAPQLRAVGGGRPMTSAHPALAIGAVAGGPGTSREWADAVKELGRRVMALRGNVTSPLAVNVVYQIPGQYLEPEFEGVRSGRFSRKEARLLVQVALPSSPTANAEDEVRQLLRNAVLAAEEFARLEGVIDGQLTDLRGLLDRL